MDFEGNPVSGFCGKGRKLIVFERMMDECGRLTTMVKGLQEQIRRQEQLLASGGVAHSRSKLMELFFLDPDKLPGDLNTSAPSTTAERL
jgi:hypothetical protein